MTDLSFEPPVPVEPLMTIYKGLVENLSEESDLKRENANIDGDSSMGTMLRYGSEGAKYFANTCVLPKDIAIAHVDGDIHIHDEDFYMLTETCCQIDLTRLFENGFSTGHGKLRAPKGILSRAALCAIVIQANQNEMHGGQAVPDFDFAMAPGVRQTFQRKLAEIVSIVEAVTSTYDEDCFPAFREAVTSREWKLGEKVEFIEAACSRWIGCAEIADDIWERAMAMTETEVHQAMEALVHNLNTLHSRAGAQVPFSSINYGTDTSPEGRMVIRQLLQATWEGLGEGETPIFPVQIFKMRRGVSFEPGDPNHDLFQYAMKVSAKRLFPNFSNLDAPFNAQFYKSGDRNTEVAYMGCRTRVMGNVHGESTTFGRGNLSFTTINLPRLAIRARQSANDTVPDFMERLDAVLDIVKAQLLHRFGIQSRRRVRNYPFLMGQGVWRDSEKLGWNDTLGEVLKHGTLTVGFIGLAETLVALIGEHHGQSDAAQELGLSIVRHMREACDRWTKELGLNFSLIATPAEGLAGRFVRIDRKLFGEIPGVTDRDYYTNSFHVPVYFPIKAFRKIDLEAPYHAFTNGGHITYVELDGDTSKNPEAFEAIIRHAHDRGVGYCSINHPVDRDPVCGFVGVIGKKCPRCGRMEGEEIPVGIANAIRRMHGLAPIGDECEEDCHHAD